MASQTTRWITTAQTLPQAPEYDNAAGAIGDFHASLVAEDRQHSGAVRNHSRIRRGALAGATVIALIAFFAAIEPKLQAPQQIASAGGVELASAPTGLLPVHAIAGDPADAQIVDAQANRLMGVNMSSSHQVAPGGTLSQRSAGQGVNVVAVDDDTDNGQQAAADTEQEADDEQDVINQEEIDNPPSPDEIANASQ